MTGQFQTIRVESADRVTTITLARPEARNAINPQMHTELQAAFDAFAADPEQFVCVLTGEGDRAFCAGSDLKARARIRLRLSAKRLCGLGPAV